MGGVVYAGGWDAPFSRTSTHRTQDFIEDSRAIERFIKQKKTSVCRLGTRGKSGKRAGCACHKSGPTPSPNPLQRLRLPYKEYLSLLPKEPGENRPQTGVRERPGGRSGPWRPGVLAGNQGVGRPRPNGRTADLTLHNALRTGVPSGRLQMPLPLPKPLRLGLYSLSRSPFFPKNFLGSQNPPTLSLYPEGWGQGSALLRPLIAVDLVPAQTS